MAAAFQVREINTAAEQTAQQPLTNDKLPNEKSTLASANTLNAEATEATEATTATEREAAQQAQHSASHLGEKKKRIDKQWIEDVCHAALCLPKTA